MGAAATSLIVLGCVFGAALAGLLLRRLLPAHHFSSETQDTVQRAMGFIATMAALILGLLVAAAKDSYDRQSSGVTQMAAKIVFLDRLLANYGPEMQEVRALYRREVDRAAQRMWPDDGGGDAQLDPRAANAEDLFTAIEAQKPTTELQSTLKTQALTTSLELGQLRWLEYEQAGSSATKPLWCILVFWLVVLFASFGMYAPTNGTALVVLFLAALSVGGAVFLILELGSPFTGFFQIPKTAFLDAMTHLGT